MTPTAGVVMLGGDRVVRAFHRLEESGLELTAGLVRGCFEHMVVEEDVHKALGLIEANMGKATGTWLRHVCWKIINDRNWRWCLLHGDLDDTRIHPSRSMHLPVSRCWI